MSTRENRSIAGEGQEEFAFGKQNYKLLMIGIGVLILGYVLMIGGGTEDPMVFSEEVFSPRRITVAPIVVLIGYALIFYAILKRDGRSTEIKS